jgi:hypothetical protein
MYATKPLVFAERYGLRILLVRGELADIPMGESVIEKGRAYAPAPAAAVDEEHLGPAFLHTYERKCLAIAVLSRGKVLDCLNCFRDVSPDADDIGFGEEMMGGSDRALPYAQKLI